MNIRTKKYFEKFWEGGTLIPLFWLIFGKFNEGGYVKSRKSMGGFKKVRPGSSSPVTFYDNWRKN